MNLETNKQIVGRYVAAFNRGDWDELRQIFADDALIYGVLGWGQIEVAIPIWKELRAAFAIELHIEGMIEEENVVAVRYTERGQSVGTFRGQEASGKTYEIVAMEWFEIKNNRIQRRWGARDSASQFRQMGLALG
jgi:steroid delta-isomerase-like uncharacterized protein